MKKYTFDPNKLTVQDNAKANLVIEKLKDLQDKGLLTKSEILWSLSEQLIEKLGRKKAYEVYTNIVHIFI